MKKIVLLTLLALMTLCNAEELKVTTLDVKRINYENGQIAPNYFRILCINGYKWLQFKDQNGSVSQMFESVNYGHPQLIKCKN